MKDRNILLFGEKCMKYIAHREEDREQLLLDHLTGTAEKAKEFAEVFGKGEWGYCCGMLHDLGKYSDKFQRRIRGEDIKVDHATAGARVCLELGGMYPFMEYCIAGHHAGLPDAGGKSDAGNSPTLNGRRKKKIEDFQAYKKEICIPELKTVPIDINKTTNAEFSLGMFMRMLYSCLVDADFLDTEEFMVNGNTGRQQGENMPQLLEKLEKHIAGWLENKEIESVNGRRTEILRACLDAGEKEKGLFRLTVPTGGGKTIASLAFALRHAVKHHMDRIIYVIPYTSIIEQNAGVFREILGDQNVLENHCNVDYESTEELKPMQLASENWDKPVIVTTNVQFFESLFANKSSKCRKLHNMANSVIIFDEAQMLPNDYLKPCLTAIEELVINYEVSAVLCTATQPALDPFFKNIKQITELCPRMEKQFTFFKRVHLENIGKLSEEALKNYLLEETHALCIVNTKKRAQKIYHELKGKGIFHLSTSMYPKHRKRVLKQVKERLANKEKCILISTSLVEAGVDIDFPVVFRQEAGLDSVLQAAGRCNREGRSAMGHTFVFSLAAEKRNPFGSMADSNNARLNLPEDSDWFAPSTMKAYFCQLYSRKQTFDEKDIKHWLYKPTELCFETASKEFRLIDDTSINVIVNWENSMELIEQLKESGCTYSLVKQLAKFTVGIRSYDFKQLKGYGLVEEILEGIYVLADRSQYNKATGLSLDNHWLEEVLMI